MNRITLTTSTFALSLVGVALLSSEARAAPPALHSVGPIRSAMGDFCIDPGSLPVNHGDNAIIWSCNGQEHQGWYLTMTGEIRNTTNPNLCLDVFGGGSAYNGKNVNLWTCNGGTNQRWRLSDSGELTTALDHNYCLDISGSASNGKNVKLWTCNGGNNQSWSTVQLPWAPITSAVGSDRCLDINGSSSAKGASAITWYCHEENNQQFFLTSEGELRSAVASDRCLSVAGGNYANGTDVMTWNCNGADDQKWLYTPSGELRSKEHHSYCLDVQGGSSALEANVHLWSCNGGNGQKWASKSLMKIEIQEIEGHLALVFGSVGNGYAVTRPDVILQMVKQFGYDDTAIEELGARMSTVQSDALDDLYGTMISVTDIAAVALPAAVVMEAVTLGGVPGEGGAFFMASASTVSARIGIDIAELQGGLLSVAGPEAVAILTADPSGGFGITTGANLIGASTQIGSSDGTFAGVGVGIGVGFEGAASWGLQDQYGFTLGIGVVSVSLYATGDDIKAFANDAANGIEAGTMGVADFAEVVAGWTEGAAADSAEWLNVASGDANDWTAVAVADVAGVGKEVLDWFGSLF